jgi:hypothetical protein
MGNRWVLEANDCLVELGCRGGGFVSIYWGYNVVG